MEALLYIAVCVSLQREDEDSTLMIVQKTRSNPGVVMNRHPINILNANPRFLSNTPTTTSHLPSPLRDSAPTFNPDLDAMESEEYQAPHEPEIVPSSNPGSVRKYCVSPTNGRLEWIQASIASTHLNKGTDITTTMTDFLLAGDKNPMDQPALIIHKSLGGRGDDVFNVFLEGRSFDRETFDNDIESTVYYGVKDSTGEAVVTVRFIFKDAVVTRPYKLAYQVVLPNGDIIENELVNV